MYPVTDFAAVVRHERKLDFRSLAKPVRVYGGATHGRGPLLDPMFSTPSRASSTMSASSVSTGTYIPPGR